MPTYATAADLAAYVEPNPDVTTPEGDEADALLERAERDVDRALGPYPPDSDTGLKLDPTLLTDAQVAALVRATCAAAEFRLQVGEGALVGDDDYISAELTILRRAGRSAPKLIEELAGTGLLNFSGTVTTTT